MTLAPNEVKLNAYEAATFKDVIPDNIFARHCPLDNGRHAVDINLDTAPSLGSLVHLPIELQQQVLRSLDIASLLVMRRVNKRGMDLVASLTEWKKITTHAAATIRMSIGLRTHHRFTIANLFDALCTQACVLCSQPAGFIDMNDLSRYCASSFEKQTWQSRAIVELGLAKLEQEKGEGDQMIGISLAGIMSFVKADWLDRKGMGKAKGS